MTQRMDPTTRLARGWGRTQSVMFEGAGRRVLGSAQNAGRAILLLTEVLGVLGQLPRVVHSLLRQIALSGFGSMMVLALITGLTGMIMGMQIGVALKQYGQTDQLGTVIALTFARELGPIWAAVTVLARVGSAMAAELGTMVVNEEVDALRCMGIDPVRYLVLPRVAALVLVLPVLALLGNLVGIAGGGVVAVTMYQSSVDSYVQVVQAALSQPIEILGGMAKAAVFGAIIAIIACDRGLNTGDGAEGVGRATTRSVELNVIAILVADLILTWTIEVLIRPLFA